MDEDQLENPVLGYVVIAAALVVGMLSATVFGQTPASTERLPQTANSIASTESSRPTSASGDVAAEPTVRRFAARCWILGVRSIPTFTGCVVTSVVPGSPAEQAGLVAGDRIMTINGRQVGWIGETLAPLDQAVDESPSRHVQILVQRVRSKSIRSLQASLASWDESLGH